MSTQPNTNPNDAKQSATYLIVNDPDPLHTQASSPGDVPVLTPIPPIPVEEHATSAEDAGHTGIPPADQNHTAAVQANPSPEKSESNPGNARSGQETPHPDTKLQGTYASGAVSGEVAHQVSSSVPSASASTGNSAPSPVVLPSSSPSLALPEHLKDTHFLYETKDAESVYLLHNSLKGHELWSGVLEILDKENQSGYNVKLLTKTQEELDSITFNFE